MREPTVPERAEGDDPRCEAVNVQGATCPYKPVPGSMYCSHHGGRAHELAKVERQKSLYSFHQTQYLQQIEAIESNPRSRSLRDEIGLTRIILQRIIDTCESDNDYILRSGEIQSVIKTLESLMKTAFVLDKETKELMTRDEAKQLAAKLLSTLATCVKNYQQREDQRSKVIIAAIGSNDLATAMEFLTATDTQTLLEEVADEFTNVISI